jgi:hypothetical protein|nr:MAG TPA: hypothetical protein [Caudoviricetes sp.]
MLTKLSDSIKRKNAEFIRDVEYIKETAYEDMLDERMESFMEDVSELSMGEIRNDLDSLNELTDEPEQDEAEVQRIMNADRDLSFNDMIGVTPDSEIKIEESEEQFDGFEY